MFSNILDWKMTETIKCLMVGDEFCFDQLIDYNWLIIAALTASLCGICLVLGRNKEYVALERKGENIMFDNSVL